MLCYFFLRRAQPVLIFICLQHSQSVLPLISYLAEQRVNSWLAETPRNQQQSMSNEKH